MTRRPDAPAHVVRIGDPKAFVAGGIEAEYDRMAVLLRIVQRHRDAARGGDGEERDLAAAQVRVDAARKAGLWTMVLGPHLADAAGGTFAADLLAACLFAEFRPSAAHAVNALLGGGEYGLTQGLLHEMLMARPREEAELHALLSPVSPLIAAGLVRCEGVGPLRRLHAGPRLVRAVLGDEAFAALPAGIRFVDHGARPLPDLVTQSETQRRLDEVIALARHAERRRRRDPLALPGPAVLFAGAPGTGKSLAARHVARALGKPLFQLDLGMIVSKWVGETERNLSRVFEQMSGTNGCILIDEADAILGKRVSVKEGRDHYVNITVGHLLMLLENHRGPVVLTTNLRGNLDDAFLRRFAAVVEFRRPDQALRRRLWRSALDAVEAEGDRDALAALAASVDLSAAEIANAATFAAALAEAADARLAAKHLSTACLREKTKAMSTFTRADLRGLEPFLEDAP